ncbi:MAG: biotin synthase BioB [Desulfobacteraceae bacterium]|nr:biotin synthase BioB [Desulfobacteraceae bacterium]
MDSSSLKEMRRAAEKGLPLSTEAALKILRSEPGDLPEVMACASLARKNRFGDALSMCSIMNAKSGACSEDCAFCAQSSRHGTNASVSSMATAGQIESAYRKAAELPVSHFGVVTSGKALKDGDIDAVCDAALRKKLVRLNWCASLGCLDGDRLLALRKAGFKRFHHNLETAESYFPQICSTHSYALRLDTLRAAREAGMEVCSGGILGMGESMEQRVEFAESLSREQPDSIPLNFLVPVEGTRLESMEIMKPLDILRTIAVFRLMNPKSEIKICAGRIHLRDLQSMVFHAGATGIMLGDLLTVAGREPLKDLQMLEDLGFTLRS